MTTKKLKHGGGKCATCGTEIDRRAKHCRAHMTGGLTTQSARSLTTKTHRDNLRRKWLIEALLALPNASSPLANPAAMLTILLEQFDQKPAWLARPAFEIAEAYAERRYPTAFSVNHARFAAAIDRVATGIRDIYVPPAHIEIVTLLLHNQITETMPAITIAQILVRALEIDCFGEGYLAAIDNVSHAIAGYGYQTYRLVSKPLTFPSRYDSI